VKALSFDPKTNQFRVSGLPVPGISDADVLVKVDACGLNPVDAKIGSWKSMVPRMDDTWVPGLDVSGHIVKLGRNVKNWKVGDRILCHGNMFRPHGGLAEYSVQDAEAIIPHPDLEADVAAATPCAGWTAWRALKDKLRVNEHRSILITGGSGGVGGFAVQIASYFNLAKIITTCSAANHNYVRDLGATHAIDYKSEDVVAQVLHITTQQGVDIGLDAVGPDNDILVANALKFEGQMVELVDTVRPHTYPDAFMKGLSFHQLSLGAGHRHGISAKAALTSAGKAFSSLVEHGKIKVSALKAISLEQAGETLNEMLKQRTVGKIVVRFKHA
jgi:NADPH:quinone reductase-like Zn-dependent oxidoreductase